MQGKSGNQHNPDETCQWQQMKKEKRGNHGHSIKQGIIVATIVLASSSFHHPRSR